MALSLRTKICLGASTGPRVICGLSDADRERPLKEVPMNSQLIEELIAQLYRQRSLLLESTGVEERETTAAGERESEIEESAQIDRITRLKHQLDERGQMMIREIEAALNRVASGTYGLCRRCKEEIAAARLRVLPTATLCIDCARAVEKTGLTVGEEKTKGLSVAYDDFEKSFYGEKDGA